MQNDFQYIINLMRSGIIPAISAGSPDYLILGEEEHPRRLPQKVPVPDYIKPYIGFPCFYCLCCLLEGSLIITINDRSYRMEPFDLCIVSPFRTNYDSYLTKDKMYKVLWINENTLRRTHFHIDCYTPGSGLSFPTKAGARDLKTEHDLIDRICQKGKDKETNWPAIQKDLTALFTGYSNKIEAEIGIFRRNRILGRDPEEVEKWDRISTYIQEHRDQNLTPQSLAEHFSMSFGHFEKLFRKYHGESVKQRLVRNQIHRALQFLYRTDWTLEKISREVGYPDPYHFSKLFKRYCGISPTAYKKKYIGYI